MSVRATTEFALHDGHRQRNKVEVTPAYRLSDNARLWVGYEYTTSQDAEDTQTTYDVHEEKTGVTFRL